MNAISQSGFFYFKYLFFIMHYISNTSFYEYIHEIKPLVNQKCIKMFLEYQLKNKKIKYVTKRKVFETLFFFALKLQKHSEKYFDFISKASMYFDSCVL